MPSIPTISMPRCYRRMPRVARIAFLTALPCLVVFCLFFFTLGHLRSYGGSGPLIRQDVIVLFPNSTSLDTIDDTSPKYEFTDGVTDTPYLINSPDRMGVQGILYDRGSGCQFNASFDAIPSAPLPAGTPRIALIAREGNCTYEQKLLFAKQDGAEGVIVYGAESPQGYTTISGGSESQVSDLPAFYVDLTVGQKLRALLRMYSGNFTDEVGNREVGNALLGTRRVRIILLPFMQYYPGIWELTLIIIIALLCISFSTSVAMQCHFYRMRRRQQRMELFMLNSQPSVKPNVDPAHLDTFPTRSFHKATASLNTVQYEARRASVNSTNSTSSQKAAQTTASPNGEGLEVVDAEMCAVCLEDYVEGDMLRKLPCDHEFHTECIDPWLTTKSPTCPLCKLDCLPPGESLNKPLVILEAPSAVHPRPSRVQRLLSRLRITRERERGRAQGASTMPEDVQDDAVVLDMMSLTQQLEIHATEASSTQSHEGSSRVEHQRGGCRFV
ncbi:uncharacterized protein VTP21DRAFT_6845 [Calcarisporiella thermophila]|uniref:uncharacterized protein n=1 Tax=Calcarisporiella thermophila TaxID=911321 RepID=UPI0037441F58